MALMLTMPRAVTEAVSTCAGLLRPMRMGPTGRPPPSDFARLKAHYTGAHFLGPRFGRDLARHLAGGDVFVFPSRTDTFGLVLLEAMACGLPVAAYPVQGPVDVVAADHTGILDEDLGAAIERARGLDRDVCVQYAGGFSWEASTAVFASNLHFNTAARAIA